jgi:hypothetical protein
LLVYKQTADLTDKKFKKDEEGKKLRTPQEFCDIRIDQAVARLNSCLHRGGDYVAKWLKALVNEIINRLSLIIICRASVV